MPKTFKRVMCKNCIYCSDMDGGPPHECRKNTPGLDEVTQNWAVWPEVPIATGWCGDGVSNDTLAMAL